MDRLKCLLLGATVALGVAAVSAGPAAGAKGGNSDNAHACQQHGHENLYEAETGLAFKNAGDCASHGAIGHSYTLLQVLTNTYPCPDGSCWGTISGSGLKPGGPWLVTDLGGDDFGTGLADATGSVSQKLLLPCGAGFQDIYAVSLTSAGARVKSAAVDSPCG